MPKLISVEPKLIRNSIRVSGQFKFLDSQRNRHKVVTTEIPLQFTHKCFKSCEKAGAKKNRIKL